VQVENGRMSSVQDATHLWNGPPKLVVVQIQLNELLEISEFPWDLAAVGGIGGSGVKGAVPL
jgi:hypothetical protein